MAKKKNAIDFAEQDLEIISKLDVIAEYTAMGVQFTAGGPRASGITECFSRERDESKPSAFVSVVTGKYCDKGDSSGGKAVSLWDFAVKHGGFPDWKVARRHFAEKAGVKVGNQTRKTTDNPIDQIDFLDWTDGYWRIVNRWCQVFKPGVTPEALQMAGARFGRYPYYKDKVTGDRHKGEFSVIALPCYGNNLLHEDPVAWVLWNATGPFLTVSRGPDHPPDKIKMKSIGATRGAMMNLHAIDRLTSQSPLIEYVWKTGGPSDMLALLSKIPESLREQHIITTNASGETGDVLGHQVNLFAGHRVVIIGDADEAGESGVLKWRQALTPVARELRAGMAPYVKTPKHGKDARDFLNGIESDLPGVS